MQTMDYFAEGLGGGGDSERERGEEKRRNNNKDGPTTKTRGKDTTLKLGAWNCAEAANQNFEKVVNKVATVIEELELDIIGLSEANVYPNTIMEGLKIPGYNMEVGRGIEKEVGANARVLMYISEELDYKRRSDLEEESTIPAIWVEVGGAGKGNFLCCTLYREHKHWRGREEELRMENQMKRWREWLNRLTNIWEGEAEAIVMGDVNLDLKRRESGMKARMQADARNKILGKGWKQMINEPTRKTKAKGKDWVESSIDWIMTNQPEKMLGTGVEWTGSGADHALVWATKDLRTPFRRKRKIQKRIWKAFNKEVMEKEAQKATWELVGEEETEEDLNRMVGELEEAIKRTMEKVAPMKIVTIRKEKNKWLKRELQERIKVVKVVQREYMSSGREEDRERWKIMRRAVAREIRQAKRKYTKKGIADKEKCSKTLWQGVKDHLGWESTGAPIRLETVEKGKGGITKKTIIKPREIGEEITKAFEEKGRKVRVAIGEPRGNYLEEVRRLHMGNVGKFSIGEVTEQDVERRLRKVENKPSYGEDEISYMDLKLLKNWVVKPLTRIYKLSLKIGHFPKRWKSSRIKPLWKGEGNSKECAGSYRPVALLSAMGRLLEGIVAERMDNYAEGRGIVHKQVHGFRKHRGVGTGMLKLWEEVLKDGGDGKKVVALAFIDVSAGFDSVPHTQLMRKLEAIGYDKGALKWLSNYLTDRTQYVVVEATDGRKYDMPVGTPQGGALGPSMWREYTNDLPESMKGGGNEEAGQCKVVNNNEHGGSQGGAGLRPSLPKVVTQLGIGSETGESRGNPVETHLKSDETASEKIKEKANTRHQPGKEVDRGGNETGEGEVVNNAETGGSRRGAETSPPTVATLLDIESETGGSRGDPAEPHLRLDEKAEKPAKSERRETEEEGDNRKAVNNLEDDGTQGGTRLRSGKSKEETLPENGSETGESKGNRVEAKLKSKENEWKEDSNWTLSTWIDRKRVQEEEEEHDRTLRRKGLIITGERKGGVEGPDRLNYRGGNKQGGTECMLYADDTTAKVAGELWPELEVKLTRMLTPMFKNMKEDRLKVNEDKTGLMIIGDRKARRRFIRGGGRRSLELAGKNIEPEDRKKSLGLTISENMNWTDHVNETVRKCKYKLRSLKKLKGVVTKEQRKKLAEGVILSRLHQHLEVISMGRRVDMEALQRVQNATMMWVGGEGKRAFRVAEAKKQTGWLDVGQVAAKATILSAMKVMSEENQEGLLEKIAKKDKQGRPRIKNVSKDELEKMNIWMKKSWSIRARRWLKLMPQELKERDPWKDSTRKAIKAWVRENVGSRCEDHILWGRWEKKENEKEEKPKGKRLEAPTTRNQMKKCGEPRRKQRKRDWEAEEEKQPGPQETEEPQDAQESKQAKKGTRVMNRKNKEDRRIAGEERRKKKKETKVRREKKIKQDREKLEDEGRKKNKNQLKLRDWLRGGKMNLNQQGPGCKEKQAKKTKKGIG